MPHSESLLDLAKRGIVQTIEQSFAGKTDESIFVLYDEESPLSRLLLQAYRELFPNAAYREVVSTDGGRIRAQIRSRAPGDLVVLIQSQNFRLDAFRIRMELFSLGLETIEYVHVARMKEAEERTYLEALAVSPTSLQEKSDRIVAALNVAPSILVKHDKNELVFQGPFEEPKRNVGDYRGMPNKGGTFPIGEVFTELKDLRLANGRCSVFAFADQDYKVQFFNPPFQIEINDGRVELTGEEPELFKNVYELVKATERPIIREIGFGLNEAISQKSPVSDVTAFERQAGLHLSMGEKHTVYKKPEIDRSVGRYHVDLFIAMDELWIGDAKLV